MIEAVVTDIEGTTSSLSFVKEVLFPYARARLEDFVRAHGREPAVRALLGEVSATVGRPLSEAEAVAQLRHWIDEDKKIAPLKTLQGMIWESGYREGDFAGHVYEDAARNLRRWKEQGLRLYVFSSGSVQAQRLLFAHSDYGDLTPLFSGYFDTAIGSKREADSYRKIAAAVAAPPARILFLSDIEEELDAARAAGMRTVHVLRAAAARSSSGHVSASDFDAIRV